MLTTFDEFRCRKNLPVEDIPVDNAFWIEVRRQPSAVRSTCIVAHRGTLHDNGRGRFRFFYKNNSTHLLECSRIENRTLPPSHFGGFERKDRRLRPLADADGFY